MVLCEGMGRLNALSMRTMKKFIADYWEPGMSMLDVGSWKKADYKTFRELVPNGYLGIDIRSGVNVDMVVKPYHWPFEDNSFDLLICGSVFEHCERFWELFIEMSRVVKYAMCIIASGNTCYKIHKYPVDCWRFLPDGFKSLASMREDIELVKAYLQPNECIGIFVKGKK